MIIKKNLNVKLYHWDGHHKQMQIQMLKWQQQLSLNFVQQNPDASSTDGSFTLDDSNSFLSPYEILMIAQENKI